MDLSFRYFLQKSYNGTQVSEILLDLFLIKIIFEQKYLIFIVFITD